MLGITGRRILLSIHIILNSIWVGGVAVIVILNLINPDTRSDGQIAAIDMAILRINDLVVMNMGFAVIVTGLLFSLFTRWGFFDFYWVIVKWVGVALLFVLITFLLAPPINGMAAISDIDGANALHNTLYKHWKHEATLYSSVLLAFLLLVIGISVFKPWGQRKKPFATRRRTVLLAGIIFGVLAFGSGAMQFTQLAMYRATPINNVSLVELSDGVYAGEESMGYLYKVEVTVREHRIDQIRILNSAGGLFGNLSSGVVDRILSQQTPNVRAITGATTSSKGLMKAVENALRSHHVLGE